MTTRQSDTVITTFVAAVLDDVSHHGAVDAVRTLGVECSRARSEEARLLEEVKTKDERIKELEAALLGALLDLRGRMGHRLLDERGECSCAACVERHALLAKVSPVTSMAIHVRKSGPPADRRIRAMAGACRPGQRAETVCGEPPGSVDIQRADVKGCKQDAAFAPRLCPRCIK